MNVIVFIGRETFVNSSNETVRSIYTINPGEFDVLNVRALH